MLTILANLKGINFCLSFYIPQVGCRGYTANCELGSLAALLGLGAAAAASTVQLY
jgi:hypothetical protein